MTLGSHQQSVGKSQTHITPRWILDALGAFDLDPCCAPNQPWRTAAIQYRLPQDGLRADWFGRVWMNPPFDRRVVGEWVRKFFEHGDGICLLHARTETEWFQPVWERADAILFLRKRVKFCDAAGREAKANSGAPVVLAAIGGGNAEALRTSGIDGYYVTNARRNAA